MRDLTAELATSFCSVPGCPDDAHGDDGLCVYHHNLDRHHGRADRRHRADRRLTTKENT